MKVNLLFKSIKINRFCLLILPIFLFGCNTNLKIAYNIDNLPSSHNSIPITVNIKELIDDRQSYPGNMLLFKNSKETRFNRGHFCINSEKHYKEESVALQISRQIAEHFDKIKLFQRTTFGSETDTDYYLSGTLSYFYGLQEFSFASNVGMAFGLIGALATSGAKTPGNIVIEIKDINLYDKKGNLIQEFGVYRKDYSEDMIADANCWCIYRNINEKLKDFNAGLAEKIQEEFNSSNIE